MVLHLTQIGKRLGSCRKGLLTHVRGSSLPKGLLYYTHWFYHQNALYNQCSQNRYTDLGGGGRDA